MAESRIFELIFTHHAALSLLAGFLLDCLLGDPHFLPHPVRFMGKSISLLERRLNSPADPAEIQRRKGGLLVFLVVLVSFLLPLMVLFAARRVSPVLSLVIESVMCWQCVAARSLRDESMRVCEALRICDLALARKSVSMIVGRDTDVLDEAGVARAAVETVAESTCDGVIAPIFYIAVFGAAGGMAYKAVNTLDSMIAYKSGRFLHFGFCAARLDDFANFIPARLSALLMILASLVLPGFSARGAPRIFLRDRKKHASPNSGQTESVCAGALGVRLAGDTVYGGVTERKDFIGDETRGIEADDIARANVLMYAATVILVLCLAILFFISLH